MSISLNQKILNQLEEDRKKQTRKLYLIEQLQDCVDAVRYIVRLHSLWAKEGEKLAEALDRDLAEAMRSAVKEFKSINNRRDVQADVRVYAKFPIEYGYELFLPDKFWVETWNGLADELGTHKKAQEKGK